jgi:hypothetical protein
MAKYLLVYRGGSQPTTPEEGAAVMSAWIAWFNQLGAAVVDGGNPIGPSTTIASDGKVTEGGAAGLTGYSILQADSLHEATVLAKGCPHLASGGTVEVYETFDAM